MPVNARELDAVTTTPHEEDQRSSLKLHGAVNTDTMEKELPAASLSQPSFHVTAPKGWLNDPCGPGYDPATGQYHLFFQWNPHGNDWGNMSWGHATSSDLVSWKISSQPVLVPSAEYDRCGVFTGCLYPAGIHGDSGALTIIYTSASRLPIHYALPYSYGSESLSVAVSRDGGKSWERQECNPILPGPPEHFSVTGWRDPCLATWSRGKQSISESKQQDLYGFISGGIVGETPTVFVYAVSPKDLRKWEFVGLLVHVGINFHPSRWSGDFGVNWEVANLMTLGDEYGNFRDFVVLKVEGGLRAEGCSKNVQEARHRRHQRGQHWMSIKPSTEPQHREDVLAAYAFSGIFDHGCFYAANSFWDPQTSRHVVYGWITDEDQPDGARHQQGWSGMISLPRVVRLVTLHNVKKARTSALRSITSIETIADISGGDTFTIHTLGISPDPRLSTLRLRHEPNQTQNQPLPVSLGALPTHFLLLTSCSWELQAEFAVGQSCERVGVEIAYTQDIEHCITLAWNPRTETFTIHRPPVQDPEINHGFETAPHTLFTFMTEHGKEIEETLQVHAFLDQNVLEVFVNERTVISTRIYHPSDKCFGVRFFTESIENCPEDTSTVLLQAEVWDKIG